jgi:hypothetical protein
MDTSSDRRAAALQRASREKISAEGGTRKCERQPMTKRQFERLRGGVETQLRWALVHGGDQELMDLLRDQSARLSMMIGQYPSQADHPAASTQQTPRPDSAPGCPNGRMIAPSGAEVGIGSHMV